MKKSTKAALTVVLVLIAAACIGYIIYYFAGQDKRSNAYDEVQKQVNLEPEKETEEPKSSEAPKEPNPIDFKQLQETNPDIYAWISIPDTNINYPIVQSATDNTYYLDNTIDGQGRAQTRSQNTRAGGPAGINLYGESECKRFF